TSANTNKIVGLNKNYVEQPKQTEHMLQNNHVEYDNNKTQDISYVTKEAGIQLRPRQWSEFIKNPYTEKLSLEMNLDNKKTEQPKAEIEANETIQKEIALNIQENGLYDPIALLYNDMPMVMMLTNTKQEDTDRSLT
ncbi:19645_t:CDS:2, partial [Cetraspora pellucida]